MFDELRRAIVAADWPEALAHALAAWRDTRAPVLADLIDRLTAVCPATAAPRHRVHPWWMARATYDPVTAGALVASGSELAHKSDLTWEALEAKHGTSPVVQRLRVAADKTFEEARARQHPAGARDLFTGMGNRNRIERLVVLAQWPSDPRVARLLVTWFVEAKLDWSWPYDHAARVFYDLVAEQLVRIADVRVIPELETCLTEPRAKTLGMRARLRRLAGEIIARLQIPREPLPAASAAELARWCPRPAIESRELDERALWRDAGAATGDDLGPILVLADYLLDRGDRRGEIITLMCSGDPENTRRGYGLLEAHWGRWFGDLALVLDRGSSTFTHGLLDVACVGTRVSPDWAFVKVARHRELLTIRALRSGWQETTERYLGFVDALERIPPRVRIDVAMIDAFVRARRSWPIRFLDLATERTSDAAGRQLVRALELASTAMPHVQHIRFPAPYRDATSELAAGVRGLPGLFPKLQRVAIDAGYYLTDAWRAQLVALEALPYVIVDHGTYAPRSRP